MQHGERLGRLEVRVDSVEEYQIRQNGALAKLNDKMDKIFLGQNRILGGLVVSIVLLLISMLLHFKITF
jgi:hypothetical protein